MTAAQRRVLAPLQADAAREVFGGNLGSTLGQSQSFPRAVLPHLYRAVQKLDLKETYLKPFIIYEFNCLKPDAFQAHGSNEFSLLTAAPTQRDVPDEGPQLDEGTRLERLLVTFQQSRAGGGIRDELL